MHIFYFFGDSITLGVNVLPKNSFYQLILDNLQEKFSVPPTKFLPVLTMNFLPGTCPAVHLYSSSCAVLWIP